MNKYVVVNWEDAETEIIKDDNALDDYINNLFDIYKVGTFDYNTNLTIFNMEKGKEEDMDLDINIQERYKTWEETSE